MATTGQQILTESSAVEALKLRLQDVKTADSRKLGSEFYLYQWLKGHNFDVGNTEKSIRKSLEWREGLRTTNVNSISKEDIYVQFPLEVEGWTKAGEPVISCEPRDVKKLISAGHGERICQNFGLQLSQAEDIWIETNEKLLKEQNNRDILNQPKSYHCLINLTNWTLSQSSNKKSIDVYLELVKSIGHFPLSMIGTGCFINVPSVFYVLLKILKPWLKFEIQIHDSQEAKWRKQVEAKFDMTTVLPMVGGTKGT